MKNLIQKSIQFLKEAYAELRKVTWLSKKEVVGSTIVVILLVGLIAVYVAGVDFLLARVLGFFLRMGGA